MGVLAARELEDPADEGDGAEREPDVDEPPPDGETQERHRAGPGDRERPPAPRRVHALVAGTLLDQPVGVVLGAAFEAWRTTRRPS